MSKLKKFINEPVMGYYFLKSRFNRQQFFKRYFDLNRKKGINSKYFILSFDCDTQDDADAAVILHSRLKSMGIKTVFAVPGELLLKAREKYKKIFAEGGEFINHGYKAHTEFNQDANKYESTFFYDKISKEAVREDILKGDQAIREVLGSIPKGFRTPHFGTFQRRKDLMYLHGILKELNYSFSTSTVPYFGFRYGLAFKSFGLFEIPVSGMWSEPLRILDSYSFYYVKFNNYSEDDYVREARQIVQMFSGSDACGLLNYYADPNHVHDKESFYKTIAEFAKVGQSINYEILLDKLGQTKENK